MKRLAVLLAVLLFLPGAGVPGETDVWLSREITVYYASVREDVHTMTFFAQEGAVIFCDGSAGMRTEELSDGEYRLSYTASVYTSVAVVSGEVTPQNPSGVTVSTMQLKDYIDSRAALYGFETDGELYSYLFEESKNADCIFEVFSVEKCMRDYFQGSLPTGAQIEEKKEEIRKNWETVFALIISLSILMICISAFMKTVSERRKKENTVDLDTKLYYNQRHAKK